jgi:putative ABC transport system permease protein
MFKNFFKITVRNILKHKGYSFINISGLAIGMACTILVFLWVRDELSFDRFNVKADNLYRIVSDSMKTSTPHSAVSPGILAGVMQNEIPGVIHSTRFLPLNLKFKYGKESFEEHGGFADADIFKMFTFPLVKGNPETVLSDPFSIVLTERMAKKYFGDQVPIGKTLITIRGTDFRVTGIMKNIPHNSHLQFDYLIPFKLMKKFGGNIDSWTNVSFYTYVLLQKGSSVQEVNQKLRKLVDQHDPEHHRYYLQPLTRVHLYSNYSFDIAVPGDIKYVTIFTLIALFILIIACINFMSLSTARSANRAKEIGIRKVVGANRFKLIYQFLGESVFQAMIGIFLALILVSLILPSFNRLTGKPLVLDYSDFKFILAFIVMVIFTGVAAGSYPALFLSSWKPVNVLKGATNKELNSRVPLLRNLLVVLQFSLAIILILGTVVVHKQLNFIKKAKLGFDKENLVYMPLGEELSKEYETVRNELLQNPNITGAAASDYLPTHVASGTSTADWEGRAADVRVQMQILSANFDYLETYNIEMREGRFFSREFSSDSANSIVINEAAVNVMAVQSPIGKRFTIEKTDYTIIGIVKNFHYKSIHYKVEPLIIMMFQPGRSGYLSVRLRPDNVPDTIKFLESKWKKFNPGYSFQFNFIDDTIDKQYKAEQQMGKIFYYFTFLAIFISCVGLFALASFIAEQKTKEIGIRKVLGATVSSIIFLFSERFIKWVLVSNLIAWPIAYIAMNKWLQGFAYRTDIGIGIFILSALPTMLIALVTVSYQSIKAAIANPVKALKYE